MKGKITKSFVDKGDEKFIRIEILDESSGELFTRVELSMEAYGLTFGAGINQIECNYNTYDNFDKLGKKKETKHEFIDIKDVKVTNDFKNIMQKLVKPFEVDGWITNEYDISSYNYHNQVGGNKYKVGFTRYV